MVFLDKFSSLAKVVKKEAWTEDDDAEEDAEKKTAATTKEFVSPLRAVSFNFRFNQLVGVFPMVISRDFMVIRFRPLRLVWTFFVKLSLIALVLTLMNLWLSEQGFNFSDLWDRAFEYERFSRTDYFAIISHYLFLQSSAIFIFFVNLKLGSHLTKLNATLKELTETISEGESGIRANPSAKKMMAYRLGVCFLCTLASVLYLLGVHSIVRNPDSSSHLDALIIVLIVVALYIENQNHMFTEMLFLRFLNVLRHHCIHTLEHLKSDHGRNRVCCYHRCRTLYEMYEAIDRTFGTDLLVTVSILVISVAFGLYLTLAFMVFIGNHGELVAFIVAYNLYWFIPCLRLYVIIEGSESVREQLRLIRLQLDTIEARMICGDEKKPDDDDDNASAATPECNLALVRRVGKLFSDPDVASGFSASGFFHLNRGILTSLLGSLVTYLIVLLQFKVTDIAAKE